MKISTQLLAFVFLFTGIQALSQTTAPKKDPEKFMNHFDVIQKLAEIQSQSSQISSVIKKWSDKTLITKASDIYLDLKTKDDGFIAMYKAVIANPKQAKKDTVNLRQKINDVLTEQNKLISLYKDNYQKQGSGASFTPPTWLSIIGTIAGTLYEEIQKASKAKKEEMKAQVDAAVLKSW